jgi:hypothetical protein
MNERIRELAERCGFRSNPNVYDRNQSFDTEKFAELIVRECIELCQKCVDDGCVEAEEPLSKIKQHFGVE